MRTRVKFCGIVRPEDAAAAARFGADAVGAVLYPHSPAAISPAEAGEVFRAAQPLISAVALFVNAAPDFVAETIAVARPSVLQFHGDEDSTYCESFGFPYIKACRVSCENDIATIAKLHPRAAAILLDSKSETQYGGTGKSFSWNLIPDNFPLPLIVAGGLTAENVGDLLSAHRPAAVDVSGGIAAAGDKRRKSYDKMKSFIRAVRAADSNDEI